MTAKEVATVLRKFPKHILNDKDFLSFTEDDFETIKRLQSGKIDKRQLTEQSAYIEDFNSNVPYFPKKDTEEIKIRNEQGTVYTYYGASDLCLALDIKQKNMWRIFAHQKGFSVKSVNNIKITNSLDRVKMIGLLRRKYKYTNNQLVYLKDDELYSLWKKLTLKN